MALSSNLGQMPLDTVGSGGGREGCQDAPRRVTHGMSTRHCADIVN